MSVLYNIEADTTLKVKSILTRASMWLAQIISTLKMASEHGPSGRNSSLNCQYELFYNDYFVKMNGLIYSNIENYKFKI